MIHQELIYLPTGKEVEVIPAPRFSSKLGLVFFCDYFFQTSSALSLVS
jgi:hypothetical protein